MSNVEKLATAADRIATVLEENRQAQRGGRESYPQPLNAAGLIVGAMKVMARDAGAGFDIGWKPVPSQFVEDGTVSCPCGSRHQFEVGELRVEECSRAFIRTNRAVLVLRLPVAEEAAA